jgi:hypothetical protein
VTISLQIAWQIDESKPSDPGVVPCHLPYPPKSVQTPYRQQRLPEPDHDTIGVPANRLLGRSDLLQGDLLCQHEV